MRKSNGVATTKRYETYDTVDPNRSSGTESGLPLDSEPQESAPIIANPADCPNYPDCGPVPLELPQSGKHSESDFGRGILQEQTAG